MMDLLSLCSDVDALVVWYQSLGAWGVLASAVMMMLCALTVLPAEAIAIANGMVYGPIWGSVVNWLSALAGANLAFGLARWKGAVIVGGLVGSKHLATLDTITCERGTRLLLLARLIPLVPFFALNYAAGLCGLKWSHFNFATAIGITPLVVALSVMGDQALQLHWTVWLTTILLCIALLFALKWVLSASTKSDPLSA